MARALVWEPQLARPLSAHCRSPLYAAHLHARKP